MRSKRATGVAGINWQTGACTSMLADVVGEIDRAGVGFA